MYFDIWQYAFVGFRTTQQNNTQTNTMQTSNYNQKMFEATGRKNKFQALVSPRDKQIKGSLPINQQAYLSMIDLDEGFETSYPPKSREVNGKLCQHHDCPRLEYYWIRHKMVPITGTITG